MTAPVSISRSLRSCPPVILLGAQRSGTTALASVLNAAFDAVDGVFTINGKLPYLLHRWCTQEDVEARHLRVDEMLHAITRKPPYGLGTERWLSSAERALRTAAAEVAAGKVTDAVALRRDVVRQAYAGASRFGEKYNEYLLELDQLEQTVPDAYWVLLIRHPSAVATSMLRWSGDRPWRPETWESALDKWVSWHQPWLNHKRANDSARCVVVEYGKLCAGGDLARLAEAMDIELGPHASGLTERATAQSPPSLPAHVDRTWRELLDRTAP
jgi:hypothetical protein